MCARTIAGSFPQPFVTMTLCLGEILRILVGRLSCRRRSGISRTNRCVCKTDALLGGVALAFAIPVSAVAKPNIVFIMADDLGYTDVACFGSKYYETPNIDRLAAQGMRFTNYHHHQNCTPTRAEPRGPG